MMHRFTFYDYFLTAVSAAIYIADFATDIALVVYFFTNNYQIWGSLSMTFVAVAGLTVLVFSFHWQVTERSLNIGSLIVHLCFLATPYRYLQVLHRGRLSRKSGSTEDITAVYRSMNDVSLLQMFSAFLESVPQLVLQLYIVLSNLDNFNTLLGFSTVFSLLSVSWSVIAYTDALHLAAKKFYKRRFVFLFTNIIWQTGMITARVVSIILFTTALGGYVGIPLALHFVVMAVWITRCTQKSEESTYCERKLSTIFLSIVHTLLYLKQKEGSSRYRMTFFYILTLVETGVFMILWYMFKPYSGPVWFDVTAFSVVFGSFGLGALAMLLYYGCCHPSGPAPIPSQKQPGFLKPGNTQYSGYHYQQKPDLEAQKPLKNNQSTKAGSRKPTVFDVSSTSARINLWLSASLDLSKEGLVDNPDSHLDPSIQQPSQQYNNRLKSDVSQHSRSDIRQHSRLNMEHSNGTILSPGSSGSNSAIKPLLGRSNQNSFLGRSRYDETSHSEMNRTGDRLDFSHASRLTENHSIPDSNIVEMFSRCSKMDPSYISNESMSEMLFNQTLKRNSDGTGRKSSISPQPLTGLYGMEQNNSLTAIESQNWNHSRVSNNSSKSLIVSDQNSPRIDESLVSPMKFSPLDPSKLWEESEQRLDSLRNSYLYNNESDPSLNKTGDRTTGDRTAVLTITPDSSRGITHLSLSYSDLNSEQKSNSIIDNSIFKREVNKSVESISNNSNSQSRSKILSFSDDSLQLPDDSNSSNRSRSRNQPDLVQSVSWENRSGSNNPPRRNKNRSSSTLGRSGNTGSIDSFTSRECSSDVQPSYLSDRGIASSDHALSSSASTNDVCGHRSMTSSGFQSEESNISLTSPKTKYDNKHLHYKPLVENEISSISLPVTMSQIPNKRASLDGDLDVDSTYLKNTTPIIDGTANEISSISEPVFKNHINKRVSLDQDIEVDTTYLKNSTPTVDGISRPANDDITPITREDNKKPSTEMLPSSLFRQAVTNNNNNNSPVLPPIGWSRRSSSSGSTNSSRGRRFFKDLSDSDSQDEVKSTEDIRGSSSNIAHHQRSNSYLERSSLSCLLSDMSSLKNSRAGTSDETLSGSDGSLKRSTRSNLSSDNDVNRATSLPYIPQDNHFYSSVTSEEISASLPHIVNNRQSLDNSLTSLHEYDNIENYSVHDSRSSSNQSVNVSSGRVVSDYLCTNEPEKHRMQELFDEYSSLKRSSKTGQVSEYMNINEVGGANVNVNVEANPDTNTFKRDKWRSSLDKAMTQNLVNDFERLAPKKLYQLQAKSAVPKKLSPVKISEYSDSPYKFRKTQDVSPSADYVNIEQFDKSEVTESPYKVRRSIELQGSSCNKKTIGSVDSVNSELGTSTSLMNPREYENIDRLNAEIYGNCPIASTESLSDDMSLHDNHGNQTYSIIDKIRGEFNQDTPTDSLWSNASELSRTKSPINTSGVNSAFRPVKSRSNSNSRSSSSEHSRSSNSSGSTSDRSYKSCRSASISPRDHLYMNLQERSLNSISPQDDDYMNIQPKSGRLSDEYSCDIENVSSFQWMQNTGVSLMTGLSETVDQTSRNYFRINNMTPPSCLNVLMNDTASQSSKHSYSDSIPWEESVDKSSNSSVNSSRPQSRQPLKSLENTPVFSPIYSNDNTHGIELTSRARFMSTPKISNNKQLSTSKTSEDSFGGLKTPRRVSGGVSMRASGDNTSTWDSQCDSEASNMSDHMGHSTFALSKTTYI